MTSIPCCTGSVVQQQNADTFRDIWYNLDHTQYSSGSTKHANPRGVPCCVHSTVTDRRVAVLSVRKTLFSRQL